MSNYNSKRITEVFDTNIEEKNINLLFEKMVSRFPNKAAVIYDKESITYEGLNKASNRLSRTLINHGLHIGDVVAVRLERSISMMIAIMAIFKAGATYLPLDFDIPNDRLEFFILNSNAKILLTQCNISYKNKICDILFIEEMLLDSNSANLELEFPLSLISYIIYTSGSTGNPKGVEVKRESLCNFIEGISEIIDFSFQKRIACLTTVSFDIFFLESIMALYKGLTVVLANEDEQRNPRSMAKLIQENKVDMIQMTPSRMQLLLNHDKELMCLKNIKEIMIGGEPFPLNLLKTLQQKTTAKIYNMYGPTETTIWSTISDLTHKNRIDIGHPIKNTEIYIVDENLSILPNGQAGEICIAGKGLAKGYVGRNDLTAEKFVYLPQKPDVRIYRTGDMGRYLPEGDLEYLGRTDNQVKIRGYRIELEEIESHLNKIDGIKQSVVIALETSETDKILQAFYTSDNTISQNYILDYLSLKIPDYMIPGTFKRVESFVQTSNGKIDRKRVLECVEIKDETPLFNDSLINELNETQAKALEVIVSTFDSKNGDVTLETGFSDAGVDSITFIKIVVALESEFDFEFDDEMLLITKFPTIRTMVEYVESKVKLSVQPGKLMSWAK